MRQQTVIDMQRRGRQIAGRRAFTLAELLVAIAVIALLMAIVASALNYGIAMARSMKCKHNLRALGQGIELRRVAVYSSGDDLMEASGWTDEIKENMGFNKEAYVCAEAVRADMAYPDIKVAVRRPEKFYYYMDTFTSYPYWDESSAAELDFAPGMWKINAEDYAALAPQEGVGIADQLPKYSPGANPREYYLIFEDQRSGDGTVGTGDVDYDDIALHVIEDPVKAELTIRTKKGATWFSFDLKGPREGEFYTDVAEGGGPFTFDLMYSSYGMNWQAEKFGMKENKILLLDYGKEVVELVGERHLDAWDQEVRPRHRGKVNVLMGSMSVITMDPDEINPEIDANAKTYWTP